MTIQQNGTTLCFFDGFATKTEALADYQRRLGSMATISESDDGIEINYNDGRKVVVKI
jgi:hypothetical protein